jgi:hypothetical protein
VERLQNFAPALVAGIANTTTVPSLSDGAALVQLARHQGYRFDELIDLIQSVA